MGCWAIGGPLWNGDNAVGWGDGDDGWAVVLTVNTGTLEITNEMPYEYDTDMGKTPALTRIDDSHYLCAYTGENKANDDWAVILKYSGDLQP